MEFVSLDNNSITVNAYETLYGKHLDLKLGRLK